ncbi:MAG: AI-2E family transporter [Bacteroidota bacterium]
MNQRSRYIALAVSLLFVAALFYYFSDIVAYVLVAWVLSMIGQPLMNFFKNLKLGNGGSAALTLTSFISLFALLVWIFVPPIVQQARNLAGIDYASLVKSLEEPINSLNNVLVEKGLMEGEIILPQDSLQTTVDTLSVEDIEKDTIQIETPETLLKSNHSLSKTLVSIDSILLANGDTVTKTNITLQINIDRPVQEIITTTPIDSSAQIQQTDTPIEKIQKRIFSAFNPARIPALFSTLISIMGNLVIALMSVLFIAFFFLKEQGLFTSAIDAFAPAGYEKQVVSAVDDSSRMLRKYFVGVSTQITIITLFMWIVLSFLGIKNALIIAFFAALINVIPYIGPIIGAMFGIFITISSNLDLSFYNEMLPLLGKVVAAFASMQLLDNFLLQPYIFSNSVSAHPLEIFIVILVGAQIGGIGGMVLAIPTYTVIRVIARSFLSEFKLVQRLTNRLDW